jgi:hypothetical protein
MRLTDRRLVLGLCAVGLPLLIEPGWEAMSAPSAAIAGVEAHTPFLVNLGDYAKGDGSDETEAIQKAIDALAPLGPKEHWTTNHPGGVLFIPRPAVAYAISKTICIVERWNTLIRCETPVLGTRNGPINHYFRWIGPDGGTMFEIRSSNGLIVENLSMTGLDEACLAPSIKACPSLSVPGRLTKGVTGIRIGPKGQAQGFATTISMNHLTIRDVAVGMQLGDYPNNGPDIRDFAFRNANIGPFSRHGIVTASGNLANATFETLHTWAGPGARSAIKVGGGELLVLNWAGNSDLHTDPDGAEIEIYAGGIHVVKAWSEWWGPVLRAYTRYPEETKGTSGTVSYPIVLEGVRHYCGGFWNEAEQRNMVPLSVRYDACVPLHLIGCSLWGGVELGEGSQSAILDQGTVFIDKDSVGFTGPGVTRYGRAIHLGTRHSDNGRILEPYVVDRRNTPGTQPPTAGVWRKGDRILNVDPDPAVPAKTWAGWICIQEGEPGKWRPFGALGQ